MTTKIHDEAEERGRQAGLRKAAEIAKVFASVLIDDRDGCLHFGNHDGAIVKARQSQTADDIAQAILSLIQSDSDKKGT